MELLQLGILTGKWSHLVAVFDSYSCRYSSVEISDGHAAYNVNIQFHSTSITMTTMMITKYSKLELCRYRYII